MPKEFDLRIFTAHRVFQIALDVNVEEQFSKDEVMINTE